MTFLSIHLPKVVLNKNSQQKLTLSLGRFEGTARVIIEIEVLNEIKLLKIVDNVEFRKGLASVDFQVPDVVGTGILRITVEKNGEIAVKELPIGIGEPPKNKLKVVFVWHHHQAPPLNPGMKIVLPWFYIHISQGSFQGFEGGPYAVHVDIHRKIPQALDVDHVSPSLLEAWMMALQNKLEMSLEDKRKIEKVLRGFKQLALEGKIEPMFSVYAHTIQGYVLKVFKERGMEEFARELLLWELKLGKKLVNKALGIEPKGVWTPELYWGEGLEKLYLEAGGRYTVLCDQHFEKAVGEKDTIYEPYLLGDTNFTLFFRDRKLSDWISFLKDPGSEENAELEARWFVAALYERQLQKPGGVVVIALDGENWMIMIEKRYAPLFLYHVYNFLVSNSDYFELTTLRSVVTKVKPTRRIEKLPEGSWIALSASQWTGGIKDELWNYVLEKLKYVASLASIIPPEEKDRLLSDENSFLYEAYKASATAIDSDYFWYAYKEPEQTLIKEWADEAERISRTALSKIRATKRDETKIEVFNGLPVTVKITLLDKKNGDEYILKVPAFSRKTVTVPDGADMYLKLGEVEQAVN